MGVWRRNALAGRPIRMTRSSYITPQGWLPGFGLRGFLHVVRASYGNRAGGLWREVAHHVEVPRLRAPGAPLSPCV